jgi:hypothetical protein
VVSKRDVTPILGLLRTIVRRQSQSNRLFQVTNHKECKEAMETFNRDLSLSLRYKEDLLKK